MQHVYIQGSNTITLKLFLQAQFLLSTHCAVINRVTTILFTPSFQVNMTEDESDSQARARDQGKKATALFQMCLYRSELTANTARY